MCVILTDILGKMSGIDKAMGHYWRSTWSIQDVVGLLDWHSCHLMNQIYVIDANEGEKI